MQRGFCLDRTAPAQRRLARHRPILVDAASRLERAGADFLGLCTNTMHKVAPAFEAAAALPILHIAYATAAEAHRQGSRRLGLPVIGLLRIEGAEAAVPGCTELGLMVRREDALLPLLDATIFHAEHAALVALSRRDVTAEG